VRRPLRLVAVLALAALAACGSSFQGELDFVAPSSRYPVSMSGTLSDEGGLIEADRIEPVGQFVWESPSCTTGKVDLSSALNQQIANVHGDAMIHFTIETARESRCINGRASGTIVKVRAAGAERG
jgi:hypothetical protein